VSSALEEAATKTNLRGQAQIRIKRRGRRREDETQRHVQRVPRGPVTKKRLLIRTLRKFVRREAPQLEEAVKWGNGCWVKGKVPVSYVYSAPDHVQL
jgi:hypothetical protein